MPMTESNQTSTVPLPLKEKKAKIFYEHGKDALELALSVAHMQEERALQKAEKHRQPQVGLSNSRPERKNRDRASDKRKRLEEAKKMISKRRADVKKEKARSRKESKSRQRRGDDAKMTAPENATGAAPRKRVSFT